MEGSGDTKCASLMDEELNYLIGDYSIPHVAELGQDSVLAHSQYAKVIFHDIADTYPTDADICCRYSLTDGVTVSHGDRIALYRVGWSSVQEHIVFEWVPVTDTTELQVLFKASSLPKDEDEFYQLCYVTTNGLVCGASVPFQFRHLHENELCAVEEQDGMMVVRSRTAFTEEKLREALVANELLQKEKDSLEKELDILEKKYNKISAEFMAGMQKITKLETEKQSLEKKLEDNLHMESHLEWLKRDLLACDKEKHESLAKLNKAEQHIQNLRATMDTLTTDKEHMAQLLRNETHNKSGTALEIIQYKGQVDSLTQMLEALTESKELASQELRMQRATNDKLQEEIYDMQTQRKVLQHNVSVLEEEKKILQEQILSVEKMSEEKTEQINDLEREKERLLSELVQSASQREKEMQLIREVYEGRLKEAANKAMIVEQDLSAVMAEADERRKDALEISQVNKCLKQQLQEAQIIISEKEQSVVQIASERTSLEADLKKAGDAQKKLIKHNEYLSARVMEIENESASLSLQLQELNIQHEKKVHFRNIFTDLEHRIINLEMKQEEIIASKNVQLERIDTIAERLSKLDVKAQTLHSEREDVAATRDIQESELARMVGNLTSLKERLKKNYLMQFDMHDDFSIETLQATVSELDAFVESSKMRISDLDQQIKEVEEEKSVLMQQQSHALEKKNEYKRREGEVHQELVELHEHEREIRQEHGGQLTALQDQCDDVSDGNNDMLAAGLTPGGKVAVAKMEKVDLQEKLQESNDSSLEQQCSSPNVTDMNTCLKQEQELKLRLQLAAAEYRKLYTEKQKVERRLTKLYHKMNEKKLKSSSALEQSKASPVAREQPVTGELISLSQAAVAGSENRTALPSQEKGGPVSCFLCPVCSVTFPRGAYDLFTQHFEAHLS